MNKKQQAGGGIQWGRMLKKMNPYTIQKGFRYLKHYGPKEFWIRLHERFEPEEVPYGPWYEAYIPDKAELEKQKKHKFAYTPRISVAVPAFRTPEVFLRQMIQSLLDQTYPNWELCIANGSPDDTEMTAILKEYASADRRICVRDLRENLGIAGNTNAALTMAPGEFVGLLDHDDLLAPNALYEIVKKLNEDRELDAVYTDEDKVTTDLSEHFQPHLKPDFNLDLLRSNNYICHFFVVRKTIVIRSAVSVRNLTGHRIMTLFSAVWRKLPAESDMYRRSFIIGVHTRHRLQIILPARCMRLMRESVQLRNILSAAVQREPYSIRKILDFTG